MSLKLKIYNQEAEAVKDLELSPTIFAVEPNQELLHQAIVAQASNERQVLAHVKDRSEVSGGGRKPWRQKGTGRARAGSSRSPIWIGGGVTFGPRKERNFTKRINQKMKQKAIFMALSDRIKNNSFAIINRLELEDYKTKQALAIINNFEEKVFSTKRRSLLIITDSKDEKLKYSVKNLEQVKLINIASINLLDILAYRYLLITESALETFTKRYLK